MNQLEKTRIVCILFMCTSMAFGFEPEIDNTGINLSAAYQPAFDNFGLEAGVYEYSKSWFSWNAGLSLLLSRRPPDIYTGGHFGFQLSSPSRLSPYIGAGLYLGFAKRKVDADNDFVDNDDDGSIDEWGEEKTEINDVFGAFYPEYGFHFWLNDRSRFGINARYYLTTPGRKQDFWMYGISYSFLTF